MRLSQRSFFLLLSSCVFLFSVGLTACGAGSTTGGTTTKPLKNISIGLGYNPDIQFAPFYVAKSKGYYQDAGLNVTFNHGIVPDLIGSMLAGKSDFVFASGDELLVAQDKNKGVQVVDVANIFQRYPVSLIVPADSPIKTLADLKGHSIGEPGPYGATHTGLLALLYKANLTASDVNLQSIGYNQVSALLAHRVDAVMGYANNEPLQLESHGLNVRTFAVSDYQPLVSNGIVVPQKTYQSDAATVKAFVQATLKGVQEVIRDPNGAVDVSKSFVPGMNTTQALAVLKATLPIYKGDGHPGYNDSATWQAMEQFLISQKMISPVNNLSQYYTNDALS
ncbi:ABC transporter substrate-binding protein [Tengunoibacter tsumagoiensis]|uniref:Riboflavin-binding protein RibY n=1 Tax=Tengunoibacter tsumagoiensis TaxID=2014871 RepID=A0A402A0N4_9CHLR|nr:ABC transporter substrate-binding protein [Tengunoibacter tsumagoiensis]GCE12710.1 riboflavin-binding protein RibY [Tengunoibacter tsumagoiensis]